MHAAGMLAEVQQQLELQPGEVDGHVAEQHLARVRQDPHLHVLILALVREGHPVQRAEQP